MKSLVYVACLSFVALAGTSLGCAAQVQDEPADEAAEENVSSAEQSIELQPLQCNDLTLVMQKQEFCDWQTGPYDTSPIMIDCTKTCVTERHWGMIPGNPPKFGCVSGTTTCGGWVCESCN